MRKPNTVPASPSPTRELLRPVRVEAKHAATASATASQRVEGQRIRPLKRPIPFPFPAEKPVEANETVEALRVIARELETLRSRVEEIAEDAERRQIVDRDIPSRTQPPATIKSDTGSFPPAPRLPEAGSTTDRTSSPKCTKTADTVSTANRRKTR